MNTKEIDDLIFLVLKSVDIPDNTFHNIKDLKVKKDICIHAYYKTIQEVNYDDFRDNNTFTKLFRKNINKSLLLNEIISN